MQEKQKIVENGKIWTQNLRLSQLSSVSGPDGSADNGEHRKLVSVSTS